MLILTRSIEESLMIGDDIEVVVLNISNKQVRLGVRAPRTVSVDRKEIYLRKLKERHQAQHNKVAVSIKYRRRRNDGTTEAN